MNLDLDQLRGLASVVDHGSFTTAARHLGRTQSGLSMQIARLEEVTGHRLLRRGRAGVSPTQEGERLLGYARRMLALHDEAVQALKPSQLAGRVRLGVPDDYASVFLPPIVARFAAEFPRVEVEIICMLSYALNREMDRNRLDLALITQRPDEDLGRVVRREPLRWIVAPDHRPETLDPLPLALFPSGCVFRDHGLKALGARDRRWRVAYSSASITGLLSAVSCGLAVTLLVESTAPPGWRRLGPDDGFPNLPEVRIALRQSSSPSVAARRLAAVLADELAARSPRRGAA
ncbi:LysR substrate-binding domain-containing protein [Vineibacter terrae]|uniref:LysR substrate-binding domain-containing protein n=1 Tax=Vineibacter terrae TaxID=2586908 RepID=UPI002E33C325|nr:LysR substrate-binding domain-containing protein [Vineibacter terrae]HEX2887528.1 LysR substrate-binding domain-containing protein [Vineibacter terrae]